jgi:ABC-2 type transport system ATP-binding protein
LRKTLWQFVRELNRAGHTIVLTTHYLDEAEALCGRIAMLKAGRIVALDSTEALLKQVSAHALRVRLNDAQALPEGLGARAVKGEEDDTWVFSFDNYDEVEPLLATLREADVGVREIDVVKPDLEQAFVDILHKATT